jgi:2-oxoglutarate ferredoxin oxidoreductase subunit beta
VVTGDGDALSIGANHLIHALRRNVPIKILMFNNQVYGLTKGQASPTSARGMVTKSTPFGAQDSPFNPLALVLGAGATFVARTVDRDRHHMTDVLRAAAAHEGSAFVEIYQNCPVFNDGAFFALTEKDRAPFNRIALVHGQPIRFGPDGEHGVARTAHGSLAIVASDRDDLLIHDAHREDPTLAFALARLAESPNDPTPIGIFRDVDRPVGITDIGRTLAQARTRLAPSALTDLLHGNDTWTVA